MGTTFAEFRAMSVYDVALTMRIETVGDATAPWGAIVLGIRDEMVEAHEYGRWTSGRREAWSAVHEIAQGAVPIPTHDVLRLGISLPDAYRMSPDGITSDMANYLSRTSDWGTFNPEYGDALSDYLARAIYLTLFPAIQRVADEIEWDDESGE